MDALVLDLVVQVMTTLSWALLAWGGWLCLGTTWQGRPTGAPERPQAVFS